MSNVATIRIKCPNCGAVLTVADNPANVGKSVRCPVCKEKYRFTEFKHVLPKKEDSDRTSLGFNEFPEDKTRLPESPQVNSFGYLIHKNHQNKYALSEGLNLIGRKTYKTTPVASIPIETEDLGFSRRHLYIEVLKGANGVVHHYAYNANNKNETTVNGVRLENDDKIILHDSDIIQSADTTLVFKVS